MFQKVAELFILKGAAISADLARVSNEQNLQKSVSDLERATDALIAPHIDQVDYSIRASAVRMAEFYRIFYVLENDIRIFVSDVLYAAYGKDWWKTKVPPDVIRA